MLEDYYVKPSTINRVRSTDSTSKKRNIELPCFVIWPSRRRFPLESSKGTNPKYAAICFPH